MEKIELSQEEMAQKFLELNQELSKEEREEELTQASLEMLEENLSQSDLLKLLEASLTQAEIAKACDEDCLIDNLIQDIKTRMSQQLDTGKSFLDYGIKVVNGQLVEADLKQTKKALTLASLVTTKSKLKDIARIIHSTPASVAWYATEYKVWIKQAKLLLINGKQVDFINAKRY